MSIKLKEKNFKKILVYKYYIHFSCLNTIQLNKIISSSTWNHVQKGIKFIIFYDYVPSIQTGIFFLS